MKITHLIIVFALILSNTAHVKASNLTLSSLVNPNIKGWKDPKAAERLMAHIDAKIAQLNEEKARNQAKTTAKDAHLTDKKRDKIDNLLTDIEGRIVELTTSKTDIERLGRDANHVYELGETSENCVVKKPHNLIIIQGANEALYIHEIRHVSLSLQTKKGLEFSNSNLLMPTFADGSADELQGYRAQYAFEPTSLPHTYHYYPTALAHISIAFIGNIQREDGAYAYLGIQKTWQDLQKIVEQSKKMKNALTVK
jgi:hypothetical protein